MSYGSVAAGRGRLSLSATAVPLALALIAVLCTIFAASSAVAQSSVGCEGIWEGPSADNDVLTCAKDKDRLLSHAKYLIFPGVAVLILLLSLLCIPIFYISSVGCCCGASTPKDAPAKKAAYCLRILIAIDVLLAVGVCVAVVYGSNQLSSELDGMLNDRVSNTTDFFDSRLTAILANVDNVKEFDSEATVSSLSSAKKEIENVTKTVEDYWSTYVKPFIIASYCLGALSLVLILFIGCFACTSCGCCARFYCCILFPCVLIFAIIAAALGVVVYFTTAFSGEVDLQLTREPGIFQWYLIPKLNKVTRLPEMRTNLDSALSTAVMEACTKLLENCDNNSVYTPTDPPIAFTCGQGISDPSQCTSIDQMVTIIQETSAKPEVKNTLCANTTGWEYDYSCSLPQCAETCTNYKAPGIMAKDIAAEVVGLSRIAVNATVSIAVAKPLLNANYIVDYLAVSVFGNRNEVRLALYITAAGYLAGAIAFILGIYITVRGVNVWGTRESKEKSKGSSSSDDDSDDSRAGVDNESRVDVNNNSRSDVNNNSRSDANSNSRTDVNDDSQPIIDNVVDESDQEMSYLSSSKK